MSKMTEMNPRMTPLTQCPGTAACMPPEALITPPHYSSKLDIFSHGVLTIQIITRNFPNPGDANRYVDDPNYPSGRVLLQLPEADRRKKDIDLIEADHPLLPKALHCIKDRDRERPSADELCEGLASLKSSTRYRDSVEQTREQTSSAQRLQLQLEAKEQELQREREDHREEFQREREYHQRELQRESEDHQRELQRAREDHQRELEQVIEEYREQYKQELQNEKRISIFLKTEKEKLTAELRDIQAREQQYREELEAMRNPASRGQSERERPADELCKGLASLKSSARYRDSVEQTREQTSSPQRLQLQLEGKNQITQRQHQRELEVKEQKYHSELQREREDHQRELQREREDHQRELEQVIEELQVQYQQELQKEKKISNSLNAEMRESQAREQQYMEELLEAMGSQTATRGIVKPPLTLTWRKKDAPPPEDLSSLHGAAVVHGNTAYFSQKRRVFSYTLLEDKWMQLQHCEYEYFSLAVINDKLTTIGGCTRRDRTPINSVLSLTKGRIGRKWEKFLPPMPTPKELPATVTATTHLVVVGGREIALGYSIVEVLDTDTLQWSTASSLPQDINSPQMTLCGGYFYISNSSSNAVFSCSVEGLLQSIQPPFQKSTSTNSSSKGGSVWTRLADIPVNSRSTLATLRGHVLALGGCDKGYQPTGAVHCYDRATNSWRFTREMLIQRYDVLAAEVLPSNELIVVGGHITSFSYNITEVCSI